MTRAAPNPLVPRLEKLEQRAVIDCFKRLGTRVYSTSQYRASHVAIGIADLWCVHRGAGKAWWFEVKKYRRTPDYSPFKPATWIPEPLRAEQQAFADECRAAGILHGWGGISEAMTFLVEQRVAQWSAHGVTVVRADMDPAPYARAPFHPEHPAHERLGRPARAPKVVS